MTTTRPARASSPWRRAAAAAAGALLATSALAAAAPTASADTFTCPPGVGSDARSQCANVINIDAGSYLAVRSGPGSDYAEVSRRDPGQTVEVECWTEGSPVHGYNIWTQLYAGSGPIYVSDYYLDSGHVQSQLPHC